MNASRTTNYFYLAGPAKSNRVGPTHSPDPAPLQPQEGDFQKAYWAWYSFQAEYCGKMNPHTSKRLSAHLECLSFPNATLKTMTLSQYVLCFINKLKAKVLALHSLNKQLN